MRGINVMRVIAGCLLAGVIMNVLGVAFAHYVLGAAYVEAFTEHLLLAALVMWLAAVLPLALALNEFGILTGWRLWVTLPETLIELSLGLLAGASVYREPGAGDGTAKAL